MKVPFIRTIIMICFVLSILFCIISWIMAYKKSNKVIWSASCSLSFMSLTLLMEYRMLLEWINKADWAALADVSPSSFKMLCGYVILILLFNAYPISKTINKN